MKAIDRHLKEIDYIEREIKRTKSWKRKKDLSKYLARLKKELRIYISFQQKNSHKTIDK